MAEMMTSRLVVNALEMPVLRRLPGSDLGAYSDRGSQYDIGRYQRLLDTKEIIWSMRRRGNCWDNAPMESFFAILGKELFHDEDYATHEQPKASIFEYIETFYNWVRRHSSLEYQSPTDYEALQPEQPLTPCPLFKENSCFGLASRRGYC